MRAAAAAATAREECRASTHAVQGVARPIVRGFCARSLAVVARKLILVLIASFEARRAARAAARGGLRAVEVEQKRGATVARGGSRWTDHGEIQTAPCEARAAAHAGSLRGRGHRRSSRACYWRPRLTPPRKTAPAFTARQLSHIISIKSRAYPVTMIRDRLGGSPRDAHTHCTCCDRRNDHVTARLPKVCMESSSSSLGVLLR